MINIIIVLVIAAIMGLADYFGHKISGLAGKNRDNWLSFSSGLLTSLIFLILIPDLIASNASQLIFLFILIGFLLMHLAEKYIYQHVTNKPDLLEDLKIIHIIGFGLDNFLVGFIIASIIETELLVILNLSVPLFLQMLMSSYSLDAINTLKSDRLSKIILSILPIAGALTGRLLEFSKEVTGNIFAFTIGILFYMIIRDVIPKGNRGRASLFLLGNLISIGFWMLRLVL